MSGFFTEDKAEGYIEYEDKHGNLFQSENEDAKHATKPQKQKKISLSSSKQDSGALPG